MLKLENGLKTSKKIYEIHKVCMFKYLELKYTQDTITSSFSPSYRFHDLLRNPIKQIWFDLFHPLII